MSMLGVGFLNEIVAEGKETRADHILNKLRGKIIHALEQKGVEVQQKDGMDISLCVWNKNTNILNFAGAYNPLYIITRKQKDLEGKVIEENGYFLHEIKADKQPIGKHQLDQVPFTTNEIQLESGDTLYSFSDGYADQFGGEKGKKFMAKRFKQMLISLQDKSLEDQKLELERTFLEWMEGYEQVDDVCVIGVRV